MSCMWSSLEMCMMQKYMCDMFKYMYIAVWLSVRCLTLVLTDLWVWIPLALAHLSGKMLLLLKLHTKIQMIKNTFTKQNTSNMSSLSTLRLNSFGGR